MIRRAAEGGVNWVDTAAVYGHAEEVVRQALAPYPVGEDVLVFTKCGLNWYNDPDAKTISTNLRPADIRFEIEQSPRRLAGGYMINEGKQQVMEPERANQPWSHHCH